MSAAGVELLVADDAEAAARAAAEHLARAAAAGAQIALAGGSTPRRAYELAAALQRDWSHAGLWWADERCVPPEDERSNFRLAQTALLARLSGPPPSVHRIKGELGGETAAKAYDEELRGLRLDLALLGLGADGHTASLFPNDPALGERERRAVAVARPDVERVTLTPPVLAAARTVLFLAVGEDKAAAAELAFGARPDRAVPASVVRSAEGRTLAVLDRRAAARLGS